VSVVTEKCEVRANEVPSAATGLTFAAGEYGGNHDLSPHPISSILARFDNGSAYLMADCQRQGVPRGNVTEVKAEVRPTQTASRDLYDDLTPFRLLLSFLYVHRLARPPDDPR
jgi:hypothetical protein